MITNVKKFKEQSKNCNYIKKIRTHKFYNEKDTVELCLQLLRKYRKKSWSWCSMEGFLTHSGSRCNPTILGLQRFFKDGLYCAYNSYGEMQDTFKALDISIENLDDIAKQVIELDTTYSDTCRSRLQQFWKAGIKMDNNGNPNLYRIDLKERTDDLVTIFHNNDDISVNLFVDFNDIKSNKFHIALEIKLYHDGPEDRGPYASGWHKWMTDIITHTFMIEGSADIVKYEDAKYILDKFNEYYLDSIIRKSFLDIIPKFVCDLNGKEVKFKTNNKRLDHCDVRNYLCDDL